MMIRVPVIGTGTALDPYRAPFPHYRLVWQNGANTQCVIEIPDDDIAAAVTAANPTTTVVGGIGTVVTALDAAGKTAVLAAIRAKYKERAPSYDVQPG